MALAMAMALWWTLRQTQSLAQPYQQSDPWYVASVHSELARVCLLARQVKAAEAPAQDLRERLDVLASALDLSGRGPRLNIRLREEQPQTTQELGELLRQTELWSSQMAAGGAHEAAALEDISQRSDALLDQLRRTVATVHLRNVQQTDLARQQLHDSFTVLSVVLASLLAGTALLIWRLVRDARSAGMLSRQLAQANRQLEVRVADRTRKVEEGRALLQFILDTSPSDVVLAEVESGRVHFINHKLTERLGLKAPPRALFLRQLLRDPAAGEQLMQALDQYGQVDAMEALIGTDSPRWSSLSARLIEVDGKLAHLLWGFDIGPHKELEAQLRELATRDALSGLLNRRAFLEQGTALFSHCRRHAQPCTVLMIDIDRFKLINDRHGHQAGDEAIRACTRILQDTLRDADLIGRMGGEEFAALLPHSSADGAMKIAERIRLSIAQMQIASPGGQPLAFTVSIGVAEMEPRHTGVEPLLNDADRALYRAKATGRNQVVAYAPAAHDGRETIGTPTPPTETFSP